ARDPSVWWNLSTAFVFMLALVLAANLFADAIREAFDPRARIFKPRRATVGLARREPAPAAPAPPTITGDPVHASLQCSRSPTCTRSSIPIRALCAPSRR